jgi:NADH:ubiquinone oxidoreductase subunit 2 (subunit N)
MILMALNSVLSLGYYAPLVNVMYRSEASPKVLAGKALTWTIALPLVVMIALIILLGLLPGWMDWLTIPAAERFLQMFGY